jgi:hypothetical protein
VVPPPPVQRPPEQSVYYDSQFNPLGTPPPGYPPMYREAQQYSLPHSPNIPTSNFHPQVLALPPTSISRPNYGYLNSLSIARPSVSPPQIVFNPYPSSIAPHRIESKTFAPTADPLDPSASGYNQRFGTEPQKRKRQFPEIPDHLKDLIPQVPQDDPPQVLVENTPAPVATKEPDPMTIVDVVPSVPLADSEAPSFNIAELMKRRKMIHSESSEVGPSLPSDVAGPSLTSEIIGPTRQEVEESSQSAAQMTSILGICYSSDSESEDAVPDPPTQIHLSLPVVKDHDFPSAPSPLHVTHAPTPHIFTELPTKPKQIQVESELVHFVPSTLRAKRNFPQSKTKSQPSQPLVTPDTSPSWIPQPEKQLNESVDAAYEEFMSEINQLG